MDLIFSIKPEAKSSAESNKQRLRRFKGRRRGARDLGVGEIINRMNIVLGRQDTERVDSGWK